ncbi:MAG: DMT family transporter [Sarcina sp.]
MLGIIFSIIAGLLMAIQGVFNTRLSQKVGLLGSNLIVQGTAFLFSVVLYFFFKDGQISNLKSINKLYLLGGLIGVIITCTVMKGINSLGPSYSISIILISQLLGAALIDVFALFDSTKLTFHWNNYLGLILMLIGILLFKFKN